VSKLGKDFKSLVCVSVCTLGTLYFFSLFALERERKRGTFVPVV